MWAVPNLNDSNAYLNSISYDEKDQYQNSTSKSILDISKIDIRTKEQIKKLHNEVKAKNSELTFYKDY